MQVLGTSKILMITRSRTVPTEAMVTTNLAHPVLFSWHDLIRLKVIDENFPLSANTVTKEDPQRALYYWRNIPRKDGYSPAQLLMGRKQFTQLPAAPALLLSAHSD